MGAERVANNDVIASAGTGGLAPLRRHHHPLRPSAASVVPVTLALLAGGFGYAALRDRSAMTGILVASKLVPAGSPVDGSDTRVVMVHSADQDLTRGLLGQAQIGLGWLATVPVRAGEPITASEVSKSPGPPMGEMSIPVPVQQAAGGLISPGDLVDIVAATGQGGAYYVAQGLRVAAVAPTASTGGILGAGETTYFVVVRIDKAGALRVAAALGAAGAANGANEVQVVRSTGEAPTGEELYPLTGAATAGSGP